MQQKVRQRSKQVNERKASIDQEKENTMKNVEKVKREADEKRTNLLEQKVSKA